MQEKVCEKGSHGVRKRVLCCAKEGLILCKKRSVRESLMLCEKGSYTAQKRVCEIGSLATGGLAFNTKT